MVCPACGTENPDGARFCLQCGSPLGGRAAAPSTSLGSYLPQGLLTKLEAARAGRAMAGERRIVTMLFCDVVGSTAMAERLDPETWTEVMNEVFERLIAPVYRYEGTLARLMGDAIFAFFGAPIAHEDDPERAVAAGLGIVDAIRAYREERRGQLAAGLDVRVGINTGPVVVGEVGSDLRVEYTAMGDAVNVAARMEQTAEPGTVQVTAETARLVRDAFELGPRRDVEAKGKEDPVAAHVVLGRTARSARGRAPAAQLSPLVGRDREMETLRRAVDDTLAGRGRMVALIGEPGLGKTRLLEETRAYWDLRRPADVDTLPTWDDWRCVSYDATRPYAQYRRMLSTVAGVADTDGSADVRRKLAGMVGADDPGSDEPHLRVWRSLFGVPVPGEAPLEGEAFRTAILDLIPRWIDGLGETPRLFAFEDLHWCDEASMDFLIETALALRDRPALLLFAFRPDAQASSRRLAEWLETEPADRSTRIVLSPLSEEDSGALIDRLLSGARSDAVRAGILARTEGNPLFLEELAASIGIDADDDTIPDTLQALITARLDTLDDEARRTLQLASVIGRTFDEPVLGAVAGDGAPLRARLDALERAGLISATSDTREPGYAFHHSLTQEAAYGTILVRDRKELHRRVGDVLEERHAAMLDEFAPVLVQHFHEAGDDDRTLRYAQMAGDHAARLYANADAITHYGVAIEAASRLDRDAALFGELFPNRGRAMQLAGRYDDAVANYEEMRERARAVGDREAELAAMLSLTTLFVTPTPKYDPDEGRRVSQTLVDLAREIGDVGVESKALWNLMNLNVFGGGDDREAVAFGERSLALAREIGDREQIAFSLTDLWRPYASTGDLEAARRTLQDARPMWRELENIPMLGENLTDSASISRLSGDDAGSLALLTEARGMAEASGNRWGLAHAEMNEVEVYLARGDVGRALDIMRELIPVAEEVGFIAPQAVTRALLSSTYAYLGDLERARETAALALEVADRSLPPARPSGLAAMAQIHLQAGELDEAEAALAETHVDRLPMPVRTEASIVIPILEGRVALARGDHPSAARFADAVLDRVRRDGIRPFVAEAMLLRGQALTAAGRTSEAAAALRAARSSAGELGHRRILWEILDALAPLAAPDETAGLLAEARDIVRSIADGVGEDLRRSFLARPDVRRLTERAASPDVA